MSIKRGGLPLERVAVCDRCHATIVVIGRDVDEALRRADWERDGDGRVTCRRCRRKAAP